MAIDRDRIDVEALEESYDTLQHIPVLPAANVTDPNAGLYLLGGYHRVSAAKKAMRALEDRLEKLERGLEKLKKPRTGGSDEDDDDITEPDQASIRTVKEEIQVVEELLEAARVWPVWFYDFRSSLPPYGAGKNH